MNIAEDQKITLTIGQLKRLVKEAKRPEFNIKYGVLKKYHGKGGDVVIPNGVENIGRYAFKNRGDITSVTFPISVTAIGVCAFQGCGGLTSITFPDSLEAICLRAFSDCWSLTSVTIPDSVDYLEYGAFEYCDNLEFVRLPSCLFKKVINNPEDYFNETPFMEKLNGYETESEKIDFLISMNHG